MARRQSLIWDSKLCLLIKAGFSGVLFLIGHSVTQALEMTEPGDTAAEVKRKLGSPTKASKRATKSGVKETWTRERT